MNFRSPASSRALAIAWFATTATGGSPAFAPGTVRLPFAGRVTIVTPARLSPSTSTKPKSAAPKAWVVSSATVTVVSVASGASFTGATSTVIV